MRWRVMRQLEYVDAVIQPGTVLATLRHDEMTREEERNVWRAERRHRTRNPNVRMVPFRWEGSMRYAFVGGASPDLAPVQ